MTDAAKKIKEKVKQLPPLSLPQGSGQMVIEIDASNKAWDEMFKIINALNMDVACQIIINL